MAKADAQAFLNRKAAEPLPDVTGKTDLQLTQMAIAKYVITNPNCASERAAVGKMREAYFLKLKTLRDEKAS